MILLTETVLSYWDYLDELHRESSPESKEEYAGIKDWVGKLVSPKPLDPLLSRRSTGRSCHIKSVSGAGSLTKGARVTPASARSSIRHSFDEPMVVDDGIPVAQSIRKGVKRPQDNQVRFRRYSLLAASQCLVGRRREVAVKCPAFKTSQDAPQRLWISAVRQWRQQQVY